MQGAPIGQRRSSESRWRHRGEEQRPGSLAPHQARPKTKGLQCNEPRASGLARRNLTGVTVAAQQPGAPDQQSDGSHANCESGLRRMVRGASKPAEPAVPPDAAADEEHDAPCDEAAHV
jgi:hypothetical protein